MTQFEIRLTAIERRNRYFMFSIFSLITLFFLTAFLPGSESKTIKCSRLEIIDSDGQIIAFLGIDEDGSRGLFINDENNRLRVATIHDSQQSAFYTFDSTGTVRIGLSQFAHGGGGLALHGENSKGASVFYHQGTGSLSFYDLEGKVKFKLPEAK